MEELIEQFYPHYSCKEGFLEIPTDIDDVYFPIECRHEYNKYPRKIRLRESFKEEL